MSNENTSPHNIGIEILREEEQNDEQKMDTALSNDKDISSVTTLDNGLDPVAMDLISTTISPLGSEEDQMVIVEEKDVEEDEEMAVNKSIDEMDDKSTETTSVSNLSIVDEATAMPKMSREMRNLQKSTQDSKVLSDFLNYSDSPRIRRKVPKESSGVDQDLTQENSSFASKILDEEVPLKGDSPENEDSDSTVVVRDESSGGKKRRRSVSRSRTIHRSKSVNSSRSRPKSLSRMLSVEMAASSDKDVDKDDDDIEEITNLAMTTQSIENRAPNAPPKPGWDSFCFKCHLDTAVLSLACSKCKCSFHRHCARLLNTPIPKNDDFICADCIEIDRIQQGTVNKYNHPKIDVHTLKDMLSTILEKIRTYPDRECYENDIQFKTLKESNQPLIITQISLKTIEERIRANYYKVSEAFLHDIKQLEHNWTILDKNKTKSLKNILKFVVTEINEMEACVHCYSSSYVISGWFVNPCKRPHLLIWAKLKGYPYWPAKVMSIDNQKQYADVRFFGAHDRAWVPTQHCLIFSEKDPNKVGKTTPTTTSSTVNKPASKSQKGIVDAMKEKDEYIQKIREKYGFRYATVREALDPENFQKQLEAQLPNLNKTSEKAENDNNQKEKLTLKIVKKSDGSQIIEPSTPKVSHEKDKNILYRVLSKNDDENNDQSRVKTIILKRNTQNDSNKSSIEDSETSESIVSVPEDKSSAPRRKSLRDASKQRKNARSISSRSVTPEPSKKKLKTTEDEKVEQVSEKPPKKSRKSILQEKETLTVVTNNSPKIPLGTHEIHNLRESSSSLKSRSHSFSRSKSIDKAPSKPNSRRLSSNSTREKPPAKNKSPPPATPSGTSTPMRKRSNSQPNPVAIHSDFNPNLKIKNEQMSDEEVVQRNQVTINDIADLVGSDKNASKRKTIVISTSDNSNDSFPQNSRARKTFPNQVQFHRLQDVLQGPSQIRNTNAMVCIPQVFPTEVESNPEPLRIQNQPKMANGHHEPDRTPTLTPSSSVMSNSTGTSTINDLRNSFQYPDLPRLVPKPTGVFSNEGNSFQRESGAVAALFSENAHRMTDYFKSLLIDTIGAVSSGVPEAQNVLLKLEVEKMKQNFNTVKLEHQMKIDKLNKDHADEITALKAAYEEKIQNILAANELDKIRLIKDVRQQCEMEKQRAIEATKREVKRVTWCSNCTKEARFYCCWNTSYCGPACQKNHWQNHQKYCTNRNSSNDNVQQNTSNNGNRQSDISPTSVGSPSAVQVPVTISLGFPNNKQILRTISVSRQTSPQLTTQQSGQGIMTTSQLVENNRHSARSPQQHTIVQAGQKIIMTPIMPSSSFVVQQHKIPSAVPQTALKAISSTLATEQALTSGLSNSMVVRTIPGNSKSPPNKTGNHLNEMITTTTIMNTAIMSPPQHNMMHSNGSIITHVPNS